MTLVMTLPVVHHINDEVQLWVLFMQRNRGGEDPWSDGHDEEVTNRMSLDHVAELSNSLPRSAKLLRFEPRISGE